MQRLALLLFLFVVRNLTFAQVLFQENFSDEPNGATSGTATGGTWNVTTAPLGTFSKQTVLGNGVFLVNNTTTEGVFQTSTIDISATGMVTISIDLVTGATSNTDYIRAYYRVDGGPEILFAELLGQLLSISTSGSAVVTGSSLQIVIRGIENTPSIFSTLYFDNLTVTQVPVLYSCTTGNWNTASSWSTVGFTGPCNASTPPTTAQVAIIGGGHTINLTADANVGGVDVRTTGTLRYTAANVDLGIELGFVRVRNGGVFNHNSQTAAQIDFNQNVGGATLRVDAGGILSIEDITLTTNANSLHYIEGAGTLTITDDILIGADNATVINNRTTGLTVADRIEFTTGTTGATFINNTVLSAASLLFDDDANSFINNGTATFSGNLAANGIADDDNSIINNAGAILNFVSLDGDAAGASGDGGDLTIINYGTINQTGTFVDIPNNTNAGNDINNMNGATWNYAGTGHDIHLRLFANNGANNFNYSATADQQIITPVATDGYSNIALQGTGAKTALANFNVYGNWDRSGTATFSPGTFTVTFSGTSPQSITTAGTEAFNNLTINNTSSSFPQIVLNSSVTVTNTLSMVSGNINLNGNQFTIGTSAASPGALSHTLTSASGRMYGGALTRYVPTTAIAIGAVGGFFPVGSATNFRPFFVGKNNIAGSGGAISVSFTDALTTSNVSIVDGASTITRRHNSFWTVTTSGITAGTWSLRAGGTGFGTIEELPDLRMSTTTGVVGTHSAATGSITDPRVNRTNLTVLQLANNFHVASTDAVNSPLPVELVAFTARVIMNQVELYWRTSSELNNDYFTIERSLDGEAFVPVGKIPGHGTTRTMHEYRYIDPQPLPGISYYRLRQTDYDGSTTFSPIVSVSFSGLGRPLLTVFPNPAGPEGFTIRISGLPENINQAPVYIYTLNGQLCMQFDVERTQGEVLEYKVRQTPPAGTYIIRGGFVLDMTKLLVIQK
ncbi:MAG: hypothetical protein N2044_06190 [Cyclobacteriaceae bacterium]|nr:hypothetical protein [Cyclobacteriaceae bacterium]